jgi:carbohydrate kinase (thermoresistant glucokinase family)
MSDPKVIILMGVSGSGKTSVGKALSDILGLSFHDGDDYHPEANIVKMAASQPLEDDDRLPWLAALHNLIHKHIQEETSLILACSALKRKYRCQLREGNPGIIFVYLHGDFDLIYKRMALRSSHYMQARMLQSQFEALEEPRNAIVVDINQSLDEIIRDIVKKIRPEEKRPGRK